VLYGTGDPAAGVGRDGDFYINTTTHFIFGPKAGGAWPAGTSLVGPVGPMGATGSLGPQGPTGTRGSLWYQGSGAPGTIAGAIANDNYLNTANGDVYTYTTSWGSPTGNIRGPQGIQGLQGIQGVQGVRGSLWYMGSGAPGTISGVQANDSYLNTANGDTYLYASGSWGSPTGNIRGPQGIQGIQGPAGAGSPATNPPLMDGTVALGTSTNFAREDHVHQSDFLAYNGYTIAESHASNAVTFALKTLAGADASASNPINFLFRNGSGGYVQRQLTSALSVTIPAAATMGQVNTAFAFRLWLAIFDDAGTLRLAAACWSLVSGGAYQSLGPAEEARGSTLQPPGNNAMQWYSGSVAVTSKFWKYVGYANYESGLATLGNWAVSPDLIEIMQPNTPKPGTVIASYYNGNTSGGSLSNTTLTAFGTAISWTCRSGANLIKYRVDGYVYLRANVTNMQGTVFLTRNGIAGKINASPANVYTMATSDFIGSFSIGVTDKPGNMTANTYMPAAQNVGTGSGMVQYSTWANELQEIMG
jgi:hypothetical protein